MRFRRAPSGPRRQWGADRRVAPLPAVPAPVSDAMVTVGRLGIVVTVAAWLAYLIVTIVSQLVDHGVQGMTFISETVGYVVIVSFLTLSALLYLVARQGALYRTRAHRRSPRAAIDEAFSDSLPTMTALIPSYREETATIRKTVLSAALQEYPFLRVVLLLDDPPRPQPGPGAELLAAARSLPAELTAWLAEPRDRFTAALDRFERSDANDPCSAREMRALAAEYDWAAQWLELRASEEVIDDHVDAFFADHVLGSLAADFAAVGAALAEGAEADGTLERSRMLQFYRRLAWTFRAEITWFERKLYASLSHEANKAMNLNSYIGLMGRSFEPRQSEDGLVLAPAGNAGSIVIPDADYLLTLDADSILLPEYCLRLVHLMMQPENHRLAVAQTPYSAFPGSATRMERIAGATTDLQHILHQGMSYHDATFWVGANAVIRKRALDDIVEIEHVDGYEIRRYVQDRTVIEDTESSLDLTIRGWRLLNYPERLSYSATPPDFGSLSIQRRRWANGGLLILPKLREHSRRAHPPGGVQLAGPGAVEGQLHGLDVLEQLGLLFLLAFPFDSKLLSPLVVLAALPYFLSMASDLHRCGYKRTDVVRIYGFNLILLPVNLAGVVKSLQQATTGKKIPFARTPKVADRTATPLLFAIAPVVIIAYSIFSFMRDYHARNWGNAAFEGGNALAATYALVAFMGLRNTLTDLVLGVVEHLYVAGEREPVQIVRRRRRAPVSRAPQWQDVLHRGAAGTDTGQYLEGDGRFKILAAPPAPPPQHNRRATDRTPEGVAHDRRATDRSGPRAPDQLQ